MIRTMIVDDDALVRLGLSDLLSGHDDIAVVAQAADGVEALELAAAHRIDVALVDIRMPRLDGIATTRRLRALPHPPRIVVLTTFDLDDYVYRSLAAGADGFLLKDADPSDIIRSVRLVADGSAMLHPTAARRLIDRFHRSEEPRSRAAKALVERLTPRERQVLSRIATGETNAEIAQALGMREATVKAHVSRIFDTLGVANRVAAAMLARDAAGT